VSKRWLARNPARRKKSRKKGNRAVKGKTNRLRYTRAMVGGTDVPRVQYLEGSGVPGEGDRRHDEPQHHQVKPGRDCVYQKKRRVRDLATTPNPGRQKTCKTHIWSKAAGGGKRGVIFFFGEKKRVRMEKFLSGRISQSRLASKRQAGSGLSKPEQGKQEISWEGRRGLGVRSTSGNANCLKHEEYSKKCSTILSR